MELYIMNKSLQTIGVIDSFESIIWTKRYLEAGEFELYIPISDTNLSLLQTGNYIYRLDDDAVMIIEDIKLETDVEKGNYITATGRSLESILDRRIVWNTTTFSGAAEDFIYKLINENAITPAITARKISNLTLDTKKGYTETISKQLTGDNLYTAITDICTAYNYGLKITLNSKKNFVFSLYKGVDRSYNQNKNPCVVFSPEFDNILKSSFERSEEEYKNIALIAGEGEGDARKKTTVGSASDLNRRELYVDARDVQSTENDVTMSDSDYIKLLQARGQEKLNELTIKEAFSGECETSNSYVYRQDWNLGDIVQIKNEFGVSASPRIIEVIESEETDKNTIIPTFATWGGND